MLFTKNKLKISRENTIFMVKKYS